MNSMSTSKSGEGWTTVQRSSGYRRWGDSEAGAAAPREMPAAFGGGGGAGRDRMVARREEESRRAWEERQRERAAKAEAEKQAKARDITNMEAFPALGGGTSAPPPKKKVGAAPLNFRDMARETAARTALEEAEAAAAAKHLALEAARRTYVSGGAGAGAAQPRLYRHGSYDDGPVDHDFPDEDGYYPPDGEDAGYYPPDGECEDENGDGTADSAEYNADLAVIRRRGDKSDW